MLIKIFENVSLAALEQEYNFFAGGVRVLSLTPIVKPGSVALLVIFEGLPKAREN